jgi:ribosome-binding protein aMBF1 (putative translation factor)
MYSYEQKQKYTVYDNRTDECVCNCKTSEECAKAMDITIDTFYHQITHKGQHGNRWTVVKQGKCEELFLKQEIMPKSLGENLKKCRKDKKIKQKTLSQKTGIPVVSLSRYENNKSTPIIWQLVTIADFLDVTLDELIGRNKIVKMLEEKER